MLPANRRKCRDCFGCLLFLAFCACLALSRCPLVRTHQSLFTNLPHTHHSQPNILSHLAGVGMFIVGYFAFTYGNIYQLGECGLFAI